MKVKNLNLDLMKKLGIEIKENVELGPLSTFHIGGPSRYFVDVDTIEQAQVLVKYCHENHVRYHILGKGSNTLFDDRGFDGLVMRIRIGYLEIHDNIIHVGAGYSFSLLGTKTAKMGLGGLEFAAGIPGSVGGAVYMNAGANKQETKDCLIEVIWIDPKGRLCRFEKQQLTFDYRYSSFQKGDGIICGAVFALYPHPQAKDEQKQHVDYRKSTQPYCDPSIGCIFRNPKGASAGALIDQAGLKSFSLGGAAVSEIHANFIVNKEQAKASEVLDLVDLVQKKVYEKTGVYLEPEFRRIPFEEESL